MVKYMQNMLLKSKITKYANLRTMNFRYSFRSVVEMNPIACEKRAITSESY